MKDPTDIFININPTPSSKIIYGNIATAESHTSYSTNSHHYPDVKYICELPTPYTTTLPNLENYISSSIKTSDNNSIYELHINTQAQNDSGAN